MGGVDIANPGPARTDPTGDEHPEAPPYAHKTHGVACPMWNWLSGETVNVSLNWKANAKRNRLKKESYANDGIEPRHMRYERNDGD